MPRTTEQKLEAARKRQAAADAAWDRTGPQTRDPGALSGIKGYNDTPDRIARNISRTTKAAREGVEAAESVKRLEHKLASEKKNAEIRENATLEVALEDLKAGDLIRYENYGHPRNVGRVLRVNQKTITIDAPEPYDKPKIDKARIIATSRPAKKEPDDE